MLAYKNTEWEVTIEREWCIVPCFGRSETPRGRIISDRVLCSWTSSLELSADGPQTQTCHTVHPYQRVGEDVSIWIVGPQRSVNFFNCSYLITLFKGGGSRVPVACVPGKMSRGKNASILSFRSVSRMLWILETYRVTHEKAERACFSYHVSK